MLPGGVPGRSATAGHCPRAPPRSSTWTATRSRRDASSAPRRGGRARDRRRSRRHSRRPVRGLLATTRGWRLAARGRCVRPGRPGAVATLGLVIHVPRGVRLDDADRGALARGTGRARSRGADHRCSWVGAPGAHPRGAAARSRTRARPTAPQRLWWGTTEVLLGDGATLEVAGAAGLRPATLAIVNRHATLGRGRTAPLGARSVGVAAPPAAASTTCSSAGARRSPGGDRLRRRQPAVRPHQLHPPHRRGHHGRPAQQGRVHGPLAGLHQGPHRDPAERRRARTASWASSACCSPSRPAR